MRAETWRCMFASVSRMPPCLLPSTGLKENPESLHLGEMTEGFMGKVYLRKKRTVLERKERKKPGGGGARL